MSRLREFPNSPNKGMRAVTDENRADATIASQATGAMSWAFITALKANPNQTYVELLNSIRELLEAKYEQKPQLSCSHPLGKSCCRADPHCDLADSMGHRYRPALRDVIC